MLCLFILQIIEMACRGSLCIRIIHGLFVRPKKRIKQTKGRICHTYNEYLLAILFNPPCMPPYKLCNNVLLNLLTRLNSSLIQSKPSFFRTATIPSFHSTFLRRIWFLCSRFICRFGRGRGRGRCGRFSRDEDDFKFSSVEFVADDYLVTIAFEGDSGFGNEECLVGFELLDGMCEYMR